MCKQNPKAKFGHSKDKRTDCRQVLIGLVVTPEGFPLDYETLPGNTAEKTTLKPLIDKIEIKYGKSRRVWLMDRGIPTENTLAMMREGGIDYLVGTPRSLLDKYQSRLSDQDWEKVSESVRVKYIDKDDECYVLAKSSERMAKERAIRKRKLRKYLEGLEKLKGYRNYERFYKRLGVLQSQAGVVHRCVELKIPKQKERIETGEFEYRFDREAYRKMICRDGTYFLRTNQTGKDAVELWQQYMLQCSVEKAFEEIKSDLNVRPVHHHKEERVDAHIFVVFMSYCLQTTLRHKLRCSASGLTAQAVLELLCRIQMLEVTFETLDGRCLVMERYTEPDAEHKMVLHHLNMELPPQKPPKIYPGQVND
jgi:transposase